MANRTYGRAGKGAGYSDQVVQGKKLKKGTFSRLHFNNPLQLINQSMVLAVQLLYSLMMNKRCRCEFATMF